MALTPQLPEAQMRTKKRGGENTNRKTALLALSISIIIVLVITQTHTTGIGPARGNTTTTTTTTNTPGTISVQGTGQVAVRPDRGIVTIGVITQATTAGTAAQNNAITSSAVITALNGIGIDNSNIQTSYYYLSPQYSYSNGVSTLTGYQVTNEFQVTVVASGQTIQQLGTDIGHAIDTATASGANQIYGVEFTASSSALQQAKLTALRDAAEDASQQAHTIASALAVNITGVVSVTTNPVYPQPVYFGLAAFASSASTPILPPQSLTVTATVQATFSIS
jgi:uncharacterized protein YggE